MGIFDRFFGKKDEETTINNNVNEEFINKYASNTNYTKIDEFVNKYDSDNNDSDISSFVDNYATDNDNTAVNNFADKYAPSSIRSKDLKNSSSLYDLAVNSGLRGQADQILKDNSGEDVNKYLSGGFISDIFDVLNTAQYGVVGMLKGQSFLDGVKSRESFADKDALGDKGLPGVIVGTLLDIAVDPFTYIAPYTVLKKVPLLGRAVDALQGAVFGKRVTKAIETAGDVAKTQEVLEGGTRAGRYLASKFAWMFGADPIYRQTIEKSSADAATAIKRISDTMKPLSGLTDDIAKKIITSDETGRFVRVPLEVLRENVSPEDFKIMESAYTTIDDLGKELVDLGVLGKGKYEENLGTYLKSIYQEHLEGVGNKLFPAGKRGIKSKSKKIVENVDEFGLTQVDNPAYLLFRSALDMTKDVQNAKIFKELNEKFGTDIAQDGFKLVPATKKFAVTGGRQAEILKDVKKINTDIKPLLAELKRTHKTDKVILKEIASIEKDLIKSTKLQGDELFKFFNEGLEVDKLAKTARKLGTIPEQLQPLANDIKKFTGEFNDYAKTSNGIKLEKSLLEGELERGGFDTAEVFFNTVKKPFKEGSEKIVKEELTGSASKLVQLQKRIEELTRKSGITKEIDKVSINDSFINLEKKISELDFKKEGLLDDLEFNKLGDLAGKYLPDYMQEYITEMVAPANNNIGKKLLGEFKYNKVVLNPGTHARNIVSNKLLNWWKLGMNPLDPRVISSDLEAVGEIAKGGGKWIDEATKLGYNADTFVSAELRGLLDSPDVNSWGKGVKGWKTARNKLGDIYQGEENMAKLSAFIFNRKKGIGPEEAWKAAESATFNYAQVTPFVRKLRESIFGMPFITFSVKATPVALETALKHPGRISVIGKAKNNIEKLSDIKTTARERAAEPAWVKDGFYVKLPMKDKHGRSAYFDLTYILPFGDLVSGNFFERGQDLEAGVKESVTDTALRKSPFIQLVRELSRNKDFYGNAIFKKSDNTAKQLGDVNRHIMKTFLPPLVSDQLPGGYDSNGNRKQRGIVGALQNEQSPETIGQKRTLMQELMRNVGAKVQPIDADLSEMYSEWNKKKGLETLLLENGKLNTFETKYVPKDK